MRRLAKAALVATIALGIATTTTAGAAPSVEKDKCKNGGYTAYVDQSTGAPFTNQGRCVSAANRGPLVPVSTAVVEPYNATLS